MRRGTVRHLTRPRRVARRASIVLRSRGLCRGPVVLLSPLQRKLSPSLQSPSTSSGAADGRFRPMWLVSGDHDPVVPLVPREILSLPRRPRGLPAVGLTSNDLADDGVVIQPQRVCLEQRYPGGICRLHARTAVLQYPARRREYYSRSRCRGIDGPNHPECRKLAMMAQRNASAPLASSPPLRAARLAGRSRRS